jgi:hypothetical protein
VDEALLAVWKDAQGFVAATRAGRRIRRSADGAWAEAERISGTWREVDGFVERRERRWLGARVVSERARIAYGDVTRFRRSTDERWLALSGPSVRDASVASLLPEDVFAVLSDNSLGLLGHGAHQGAATGE